MKFLTFLLIFLLFLFKAECQTNSGYVFTPELPKILCIYNMTWQPDSTNNNAKISEIMRLEIGSNVSSFESLGHYLGDSLFKTVQSAITTQSSLQAYADKSNKLPNSSAKFKIYKDLKTSQVFFYDKVGNVMYNYLEFFPKQIWQLSPMKSMIAGYQCQKAMIFFGGRKYEAWFTREIPITDGPYKFCGLPGLIVKIEDIRKQYSFELIKVKNISSTQVISLPPKSIPTNKIALKKAKIDYYATLANKIAAMTANNNQTGLVLPAKKLKNSIELR